MRIEKPCKQEKFLSSADDRFFFEQCQRLVSMARMALEEAESYSEHIVNPYWKGRARRTLETL